MPEFSAQQEEGMRLIYDETRMALQVVLAARSFAPGLYRADDYREDWKRAG